MFEKYHDEQSPDQGGIEINAYAGIDFAARRGIAYAVSITATFVGRL